MGKWKDIHVVTLNSRPILGVRVNLWAQFFLISYCNEEKGESELLIVPCSEGVLFYLAIWARGRRFSLLLEFLGEGDFFIHQLLSLGSFVDPPRTSITVYK